MLLSGSPVRSVNAGDTGLGIDEDDDTAGDSFWGRLGSKNITIKTITTFNTLEK